MHVKMCISFCSLLYEISDAPSTCSSTVSRLWLSTVDLHAAIILSNRDKSSSLPFLYFVKLKTGQTSRVKISPKTQQNLDRIKLGNVAERCYAALH